MAGRLTSGLDLQFLDFLACARSRSAMRRQFQHFEKIQPGSGLVATCRPDQAAFRKRFYVFFFEQ